MPYIQYLLPGSITMSIFMMVMIGGGIIYIDDKARGLHEGYLVTPVTKFELIAGFNLSGTIKAFLAGAMITIVGSYIAGIPNPLDPLRLLRTFLVVGTTSFALISLMFLLMVRISDPLAPRAMFGLLNTRAVFPERRRLSAAGVPRMDAGDCDRRSVHLRGARIQEPAAEEHRLRGDRRRPALSHGVFRDRDECRDAVVQEDAVGAKGAVRGQGAKVNELDTRERLVAEAARLFAARGFARVTVRDICRAAHANVAAINYHFHGKRGLYDAVVQSAIDQMRATTATIIEAGGGQPPRATVDDVRRDLPAACDRDAGQLDPSAHDARAQRADGGARSGGSTGAGAADEVSRRRRSPSCSGAGLTTRACGVR